MGTSLVALVAHWCHTHTNVCLGSSPGLTQQSGWVDAMLTAELLQYDLWCAAHCQYGPLVCVRGQ